ncbi:MAG TPA: MerR family transcriptional regulator [Spirochaetia bacterium]|jgi:DNA-binding transcriptional MerR regulator|nr:MerR family transcriptional regulator [Spirochaetia bacterium]
MKTVKEVADLAGITPRTLHHWDALGLFRPALVGANGYRYYDEADLLKLQQILLYRELGLDLDTIGQLVEGPGFSVVRTLEAHRKALRRRIARLQTLVETVDRTIAAQTGGTKMNDKDLFEGLTAQEKEYAEEAMTRWDPEVVKESNRRYARLSEGEKTALKAEQQAVGVDWARLIGTDPAGPAARAMVERWRRGIAFFYEPTPEGLLGLARMYNDDPRFKANYDRVDPRLAGYILECVTAAYPGETTRT